jgi:nucleoside-triphosphatase THEP1
VRRGTLLILTGARGAGKSAFCERLAETARSEGRTVAGVLSRAVLAGGRKTGIEVEDLRSGERKSLATETAQGTSPRGPRWDFDEEALAWGDAALAASVPCDLLVVDELGPLEFDRGHGWQAGFAALDSGDYALAVVVVRPELLARARERWPGAETLDVSAANPGGEEIDRLVGGPLARSGPIAPHPDAVRWDAKYRDPGSRGPAAPREFLLEFEGALPESGWALDVATGEGGNAGYLIERGLRVVGVDISAVALREAKRRLPDLHAVRADAGRFPFPAARFDVILNFFFLDRRLWRAYDAAIRPGGLLVIETLLVDTLSVRPDMDPRFLLERGELLDAFRRWNVLAYREEWVERRGKPRAVAGRAARRGKGAS